MFTLDSKSNQYSLIISFSVFLFYAINQSVPSGYSYGASLLLAASFFFLACRPALGLTAEDKTYLYALISFFAVAVFVCLLHGNPIRTLDMPSRFLLAIPIFLLLLKVPPRLPWFWAGVALGSYSVCGVALWQLHVLGMRDVQGLTNGVRFGGISTMFSVLCIAGLFWAQRENVKHVWLWRLALALGMVGAAYGSIMSGTRGAWISIPVVFVLFCIGSCNKHNIYRVGTVVVVLLAVVSAWYVAMPNNPVEKRYEQAVKDISNYVEKDNAKGSIGARFEIWRAATINIPQKPIFGWGVDEYRAQLEQQVASKELDPVVLTLAHTHNLYLATLVYQGIFGLLPILALFVFPFWFFCRRLLSDNRNVRVLAIAGGSQLAVFGILGASHTVLYRNDSLLFFFITLMTLWGCMKREEAGGSGR
ncbi:O-antigen ligase family protein [Pusillimonas sp. SM2304]|uniref:O-antigen ligase family protein n=1 Tax=Pusillimonas sp. SM2304 TaxID=3073241 RepID=UPI0028757347|nr:O-antigen ligase family protein [Pusillimonas sp. SM2304]MDS1140030.1 O-antigen ligase family protein [Pusillimonas sp. SM2304]